MNASNAYIEMELTIYFLLERNYFQTRKYVIVTGVYPSRIGFKGIAAEPLRLSRDLTGRMEQYIDK